jgi:hypothetical protein
VPASRPREWQACRIARRARAGQHQRRAPSGSLRRQRFTGQQIAIVVGVSPATVSRILKQRKLSRWRDLEPAEPVRRYEWAHPGDMIHLDIKRLGRFEKAGHCRIASRKTLRNWFVASPEMLLVKARAAMMPSPPGRHHEDEDDACHAHGTRQCGLGLLCGRSEQGQAQDLGGVRRGNGVP